MWISLGLGVPLPGLERRVGHFSLPVVAVVAAVGVGVGVIWGVMEPTRSEMRDVALLMSGSAAISLLAFVAMDRYLARRPLGGLGGRIVAVSLFSGVLALMNVLITAGFMFLSSHDLTLLVVLMLFALLVSAMLGMVVARSVAQPVVDLAAAIDGVRDGDDVVFPERERDDEVGRLADALQAMTARLQEAAAHRRQAESSRRELVASISHDLRTPLASARLMVEAIEDAVLDEATERSYIVRIRAELQRLDRLIEDLFELSRIESGSFPLAIEPTSVAELVAESVESVRAQAERRSVQVVETVEADLPVIRVDPWCVHRALRNVLENAVRYAPAHGEVRVVARLLAGVGDGVEVTVSDGGPGIAPEVASRVFEPFFRGDVARSRDGGGAGLGLAIARGLVEAHGGTVSLDAARDDGATFTVMLPFGAPPEVAGAAV
jgi:signal transduction histidine kinase